MINMKKKAYVFFADGFEEIEALSTVDVLRRSGVDVEMISVTPNEIVKGAHEVEVLCDKNIESCDFSDADLLLLPGGMPGASTLGGCKYLCTSLINAVENGILVAAICAAPMVLGKLGLLKGRKATCYPGFEHFLDGAECTGADVVKDGNVITGKGPGLSLPFAFTVATAMVGEEKAKEVAAAMLVID